MTLWERLKACDDGLPEPTSAEGLVVRFDRVYARDCDESSGGAMVGVRGDELRTYCSSIRLACARIRVLLGLPPKSATAAPQDGR